VVEDEIEDFPRLPQRREGAAHFRHSPDGRGPIRGGVVLRHVSCAISFARGRVVERMARAGTVVREKAGEAPIELEAAPV
jgi:hypothetical protein